MANFANLYSLRQPKAVPPLLDEEVCSVYFRTYDLRIMLYIQSTMLYN